MALNQTSLDPRSRPGTIFTGLGINPYEVWQGRVQQEADAAKLAAAKQAQADAVKKAQLEAGKVEFGKVYREHAQEFTQATNGFLQNDADRVRKFNMTKNPDDDIFTYGSRAWNERQNEINTLKNYSEHSQQQQAIADKFEQEMISNPGKYTQEDIEAVRTLARMSPFEVIYNKIDISNPEILGHWDKQKTLSDAKSLLDKEGWGNATYDEASDMFTTQSGEEITPLRIKQTAVALTDPKSQSGMRWAIEIQGMSDEEKKRLEGEAEKMSKELGVPVSAAAAKAYQDMKQFVISSYEETKSRAGYEAAYGYGEKAGADRIVKYLSGISSDNPEVVKWESVEEIFGAPAGKAEQAKGLYGVPLGKIPTEKGEIQAYAGNLYKFQKGGKNFIKMEVILNNGQLVKTIESPQEDFMNNNIQLFIEGSPELKSGNVYKAAQEQKRIKESGYVTPDQKGGTTGTGTTDPMYSTTVTGK